MYGILSSYSARVEPVSCDEAYLDVTGLGDPEELARRIRCEIYDTTRCPASAGIGPNKLLAKMATSKAKPDGQYRVLSAEISAFLCEVPLHDIPGIAVTSRDSPVDDRAPRHRMVADREAPSRRNRNDGAGDGEIREVADRCVRRKDRKDDVESITWD